VTEKALSFQVGGTRLAVTLHVPAGKRRAPGVVMCHGFTGNRIEAHFIFVKAARALARAGIAALRFDFRGSGESGGEFGSMTVPGEIADARTAVRFLSRHPRIDARRIGLLGLSLGGLVAANTAVRERSVRSLALWCASADPASMFRRLRTWGGNPRREGKLLDVGGLGVGQAFFRNPRAVDPVRALAGCRRPFPILILKGTADPVISMEENALYLRNLRDGAHPVRQVLVQGGGHTFERLDHEREAIGVTVDWFRKTLK